MEGQEHRRQRLLVGTILMLVLLGALVVALDWREVRGLVGEVDWELAPLALLFTAISYACLSYGLAAVYRIFGIRMGQRDLLEIGFVSIVLNQLITVGGLAGLSLRVLLMRQRGLATADIVAPSLFHSYFNNLAMFSLLPVGLVHLLVSYPLSPGQAIGVGVVAGVVALFLVLASLVVFSTSARVAALRVLARGWLLVARRDIRASLGEFGTALGRGVAVTRARPFVLSLPLGLIVGDWVASVAALWFCFDALGSPLGLGVLLTGFGVGITVGLLSMVPGGLGVQEASMSGIYVLLGVPLHQAVLAAILFRVTYYFIPFVASLGFYRRLLKVTGQARA